MRLTRIGTVIFVLLAVIVGFGCESSDPGAKADDSVEITGIEPAGSLVAGDLTEFVVTVSYSLVTSAEGELNIGFNNGTDPEWYIGVVNSATNVTRGTGDHAFVVSASVRDWGSAADFKVYVNLSESPHGFPWTPLADDTLVLPVVPKEGASDE